MQEKMNKTSNKSPQKKVSYPSINDVNKEPPKVYHHYHLLLSMVGAHLFFNCFDYHIQIIYFEIKCLF